MSFPYEGVRRALPHVVHERGAKASDACAAAMTYTGVDDAKRTGFQKTLGYLLGCNVAVWRQALRKIWGVAEVCKRCAEVGDILIVHHGIFEARDLRESKTLMVRNLILRRGEREGGIPRSPTRPVESAAKRVCVRESRIDDAVAWDSEDKFMRADPRKEVVLRLDAIVRHVAQIGDVLQMSLGFRNPRQNAYTCPAGSRGNKPMRVSTADP